MYQVIYSDPPYRYHFSRSKSRRVENHYPTLTTHEIGKLPVQEISDANSVLFLWAPAPKLPEALLVMLAWGFHYKTNATWDKERIGMGYYWRGQHEHLLLGTRGKPGVPLPGDRHPSVIRLKRERHSSKPFYARRMIERMYPNARRIELFARDQYSGWDVWGDEVTPGKSLLEMVNDKSSDCGGEPIVRADT